MSVFSSPRWAHKRDDSGHRVTIAHGSLCWNWCVSEAPSKYHLLASPCTGVFFLPFLPPSFLHLPLHVPLRKLKKGIYKSFGRDNKKWRSHSRCWALEYHLGLSNTNSNSLLHRHSEGWDATVTQGQAGRKKKSRNSGSSLKMFTGTSKIDLCY